MSVQCVCFVGKTFKMILVQFIGTRSPPLILFKSAVYWTRESPIFVSKDYPFNIFMPIYVRWTGSNIYSFTEHYNFIDQENNQKIATAK